MENYVAITVESGGLRIRGLSDEDARATAAMLLGVDEKQITIEPYKWKGAE